MIDDIKVFEESFNLLCGKLIGSGASRKVFNCKLNDQWVVKVEDAEYRTFQNVYEMRFWDENLYNEKVSKWLAPCKFLSPDGRILIQEKCQPARIEEFPEKLPSFMTDLKISNFGIYKNNLVLVDYGIILQQTSTKLKNIKEELYNDE